MLNFAEKSLNPVWEWLISILESTENQLNYGQVLGAASSRDYPNHPLYKSTLLTDKIS